MVLWLSPLVALGIAGFLLYQALEQKKHKSQLLSSETLTTGTLKQLHEAATTAAGPGAYAELVELEGTAQPTKKGPLTSEISGTECVWYRQKVTRERRETYYDSNGNKRSRTRSEVVSDNCSNQAFLLTDDEGSVRIKPGKHIKGVQKSVDENRAHEKGKGRTNLEIGSFKLSLPAGNEDGDLLGHHYEEWVLTPGTQIFVSGQASDRGGKLEVRDPEGKEKLVISTQSESELLEEHNKSFWMYAAGAVGMVLVAIGLLGYAIYNAL